jgi:hypothetical protein
MSTSTGPATPAAAPPARDAGARPGPRRQRPRLPERSREAKQRAAAILEVLAGARSPLAAAGALGVSLPRYYLLEEQALAGLVAACEPRPRGPQPDGRRRCQELERACARWQQECARQQALLRAAQRSLGLAAPAPAAAKAAGRKRRRPTVRALQAAARWRPQEEPAATSAATSGALPS